MQVELNYDINKLVESVQALKGVLEHIMIYADDNEERVSEMDKLKSLVEDKLGKGTDFLKIIKKAVKEVQIQVPEFVAENKVILRWSYEKEDFNTSEPYAEVFQYINDRFQLQTKLNKMADEAKKAGFTGFKKAYGAYMSSMKLTNQSRNEKNNPTDFPGQPLELEAGQWLCDYDGVKIVDGYGTSYACCHPIMPTERLVNIDTGEEKINIAFSKSKRWRNMIVSKEITAVASKITQLAARGVAVTSENAKLLVKYLCDIENMNLEIIPEYESVSRLGFVDDDKFSPYVPGLIFDGETAYSMIFKAVSDSKGNFEDWLKVAKKCRSESLVARIMLSASFASVLIKKVGGLPFFVHLWSCESGTGKTVALMLSASVWGNPEPGTYIQSFNSTTVGHEKMAAFLNNIPLCIDELQLSKDHHGKNRFDVYQLAQGVGRTRGNKSGGVDITPTWSNTILTTGETPIVKDGSGAGAVNRVIDLECPIGQKVVQDGQGTANAVKSNYGHAGRMFVEKADFEKAKQLYEKYFEALSQGETTEKQSMAAALIMAADEMTSEMFFDTEPLEISQMTTFLKSKASVSVGERGYQYMCDWVAMNIRNFILPTDSGDNVPLKVFGIANGTEPDWICINQSIFRQVAEEGGYNDRALLSYLRSRALIQTRAKGFSKCKRILGVLTECIVMKLPDVEPEERDEVDII